MNPSERDTNDRVMAAIIATVAVIVCAVTWAIFCTGCMSNDSRQAPNITVGNITVNGAKGAAVPAIAFNFGQTGNATNQAKPIDFGKVETAAGDSALEKIPAPQSEIPKSAIDEILPEMNGK